MPGVRPRWAAARKGAAVLACGAPMVAIAVPIAASATPASPAGTSPSPSGAPLASAGGASLTFATYNICKPKCGTGRFSWANRRLKVARNIAAANADVVAIQEAEFGRQENGVPHWEEVAKLLSDKGYSIANDNLVPCERTCIRDTHVFYRRNDVELAPLTNWTTGTPSAGLESLHALTQPADWGSVHNRSFSWAFLRDRITKATFLAISVHLPVDKTRTGERIRVASAQAIATWAAGALADRGQPDMPVLVMGDLNSFAARQPNGAQRVLFNNGYRDSFRAEMKVNARYPTANHSRLDTKDSGWPRRPRAASGKASRIDYILVKDATRLMRYEVFLKLRKHGRFNERFRASDHNLVRAVIELPPTA